MAKWFLAVLVLLPIAKHSLATETQAEPYTPSNENLAAREWFSDARFGVFIHWGAYSVLGRGEWVMNNEKMTVDQYRKVAEQFNPVDYDAAEWVSLFKKAGAKYVTITSKHHDGFAMWDSEATEWDIVDSSPYGKDVLKPLAEECKRQGLKLFFYHSQLDWTHPEYFPRGGTGKHSGRPNEGDFDRYLDFMDAQLTELLSGDYGEVGGIWFDGWWDQQSRRREEDKEKRKLIDPLKTEIDWRLRQTYDLIHRLQPACLVGSNHHIAPFAGEDFQMFERDLPGQNRGGHSELAVIGKLPLETCDTINRSWGYNAEDKQVKSTKELVHYLVRAAGQNANFLLNVGPKPDGTIQEEFVDRLSSIGEWLAKYGDTIYGSEAGPCGPAEWGVSTQKDGNVYLHILVPPQPNEGGWTTLPGTAKLGVKSLSLYGSKSEVQFQHSEDGTLQVRLSAGAEQPIDTILVVAAE